MARHVWFVFVALSTTIALPGVADASSPRVAIGSQHGERQDHPGQQGRSGRRIKWWLDESSRLELGITDQQSAEIEQIFQATLPRLRAVRKELDELEGKLSQMIKEGVAPVTAITEQVERVENARAEMNKIRTVMLYRIDRVLSADQRTRLKAWHERQGTQPPGASPGRH